MSNCIKKAWDAFVIWFRSIYGYPFREHPLDKKSVWKRISLRLRQAGEVIWHDCSVTDTATFRAAAMTYSTITAMIPLFVIAILIARQNQVVLDALVRVLEYILAGNTDVIHAFREAATEKAQINLGDGNLLSGLFVISFILISVNCFFIRIQRRINDIWQAKDPGLKKNFYSILMWSVGAAVLVIWSILLSVIKNDSLKDAVSFLVVATVLTHAQVILPYKRKVHFRQSIIVSVFASGILVFGWRHAFTLFTKGFEVYVNNPMFAAGLSALLIVYLSWFICFLFAEICSIIDNSDSYYFKEEVEGLQPFTKYYITIFVIASIIRHNKEQVERQENGEVIKSLWPTLDEVREGMFENDKAALAIPMSLLISIMQDLIRRKFVYEEELKTPLLKKNYFVYRLSSDYDPDTLTIGKLLYDLMFNGIEKLRVDYKHVDKNLNVLLRQHLKTAFSFTPQLVCNIPNDFAFCDLIEQDPNIFEDGVYEEAMAIRKEARKKDSDHKQSKEYLSKYIKDTIEKGAKKDSLIEQVNDADDNMFYPLTKEEYIELIKNS